MELNTSGISAAEVGRMGRDLALAAKALNTIHNWHDAAICLVVIVIWYGCQVMLQLTKRVTFVSLLKREIRFRQK